MALWMVFNQHHSPYLSQSELILWVSSLADAHFKSKKTKTEDAITHQNPFLQDLEMRR